MDMSFANQFLSQIRLADVSRNGEEWENRVYDIPVEQDQDIAKLKLDTMGFGIDELTDEQQAYIMDYAAGT
jgi:adenosylhomocysteinase